MRNFVGSHDILFITLDSLRYDVAVTALESGATPHLSTLLPSTGWEKRQTPGNFTFPAHQAFFSGFLPTSSPQTYRLYASRYHGSKRSNNTTFLYDEASLPEALAARGYRTLCIGGVGFFNQLTSLGKVLPSLFQEAYWDPTMGPSSPRSPEAQVSRAVKLIEESDYSQRLFVFINFSATHTPTSIFLEGSEEDSVNTQRAALEAIDRELPRLFTALKARGETLAIICADHGEAFGEEGFYGHGNNHPTVLTVPYIEALL